MSIDRDGNIVLSSELVDAILEVGPIFHTTSDGRPVCIVAQLITTKAQREREFLSTDTIADHARKLGGGS